MAEGVEAELEQAIDRILKSASPRKLVVAGPGTGKTTLFKRLLEDSPGTADTRLILTFIRNLRADLDRSLGHLARVSTLHGYCQELLHKHAALRGGLTENFRCVPEMASLIKKDLEHILGMPPPPFVQGMRSLKEHGELEFYFRRANYYDAVDFDDSVFRTYKELRNNPGQAETLDLLLIDEFQDFTRMEAAFIEILASKNKIVIAGDDDQALYGQLRDASWDYIRALYNGDLYEKFPLPFCMRCPEVIVEAVNDVITAARKLLKLKGRIDKPYKHYPPRKGDDSRRYPKIGRVETTVQTSKANYAGRYIAEAILTIPQDDIDESEKSNEPTVLIIGPKHFLRPVEECLIERGMPVESREDDTFGHMKEQGLQILSEDAEANIGWRIMIEGCKGDFAQKAVKATENEKAKLAHVLPVPFKDEVLKEVAAWKEKEPERAKAKNEAKEAGRLRIKLASFQGAKGLSAQHVFILGMHEGDLPRDGANIKDIEVCCFLVGLTRTKKSCTVVHTRRFANQEKTASPFLSWIRADRYSRTFVNVEYWKRKK